MYLYGNVQEHQDLLDIFVCQKFQSTVSAQMVQQMAHWERHHGTKWLVNRLKLMKAYLLTGVADKSIRLHEDGTFVGAFRHLSRVALRNRKGSILADRCLRVYGRWESTQITASDYLSFKASVELTPEPSRDIPLRIPPLMVRAAKSAVRANFNLALPISKKKKVPFSKGRKSEWDTHPMEHYQILQEQCPNLLRKHLSFFQDHIFSVDYYHEDYDQSFGSFWNPDEDPLQFDVAGRIAGLTKDRGLKKRYIANPHRLLQMATSRLQNAANRTLEGLEVSLVHDQSLSEDWIVGQLEKGKRIWSLDLSSATDNFPLWYQEEVARKLFPHLDADINLWLDICSLLWELPITDKQQDALLAEKYSHLSPSLRPKYTESVRYTKGQPMGTAPSFAIFTLSHIALLYSLGGTTENFRVVGDDVVISCGKLAYDYQHYMKLLGVAISTSKSIFNSTRAEFAGRICDIRGFWPSYKSSPIQLGKDPFGPYRQFGLRGATFVPLSKREMMTTLAKIPGLGPKHCWDITILEKYDERAFVEIFRLRKEPFPKGGIRPVDLFRYLRVSDKDPQSLIEEIASKAFSLFEESQQYSAGFLGVIGVNNDVHPIFIDHLNEMQNDDPSPLKGEVLELWTQNLQRGQNLSWDDQVSKTPISFLKKVWKILSKWEYPQEDV